MSVLISNLNQQTLLDPLKAEAIAKRLNNEEERDEDQWTYEPAEAGGGMYVINVYDSTNELLGTL